MICTHFIGHAKETSQHTYVDARLCIIADDGIGNDAAAIMHADCTNEHRIES